MAYAIYPWKENPVVLGNNYDQARKLLQSLENRLLKSKETMEKFNGQIQDFKERHVLRKLDG